MSDARNTPSPYMVAVMAVLGGVVIALLTPWAVSHGESRGFGLAVVLLFLAFFALGVVYAWKRGGLDWDRTATPGRDASEPR